jgi:hypothetical protein
MYNESTNCLNLRNFRSFDSKHMGPETPSKGNQVDLFTLEYDLNVHIYIYEDKLFFKCLSFWRIKYPCNRIWPFTFKPWVPVVIYFLIFRNCMIKFGNLSSQFHFFLKLINLFREILLALPTPKKRAYGYESVLKSIQLNTLFFLLHGLWMELWWIFLGATM